MKKHFRYARYLAIHKWFVMVALFRRGLYWQGIVHDWSKFLPSEWLPYAQSFYGEKPSDGDRARAAMVLGYDPWPSPQFVRDRFDRAWLAHQHRNPHHWQHWVLREDSGDTKVLWMPRRYVLEMVSDWDGAGRAITGKSGETWQWYQQNAEKIHLHPDTRRQVEELLNIAPIQKS